MITYVDVDDSELDDGLFLMFLYAVRKLTPMAPCTISTTVVWLFAALLIALWKTRNDKQHGWNAESRDIA
jgi:hypothetical protein